MYWEHFFPNDNKVSSLSSSSSSRLSKKKKKKKKKVVVVVVVFSNVGVFSMVGRPGRRRRQSRIIERGVKSLSKNNI